MLEHAYEVCLASFQRWDDVGRDVLKKIRDQEAKRRAGISELHACLVLDNPSDFDLSQWIFVFSPKLPNADPMALPWPTLYYPTDPHLLALRPNALDDFELHMTNLVPNKLAAEAMSAATGYAAKTIRPMISKDKKFRERAEKATRDAAAKFAGDRGKTSPGATKDK